jgi:hypothetical protein
MTHEQRIHMVKEEKNVKRQQTRVSGKNRSWLRPLNEVRVASIPMPEWECSLGENIDMNIYGPNQIPPGCNFSAIMDTVLYTTHLMLTKKSIPNIEIRKLLHLRDTATACPAFAHFHIQQHNVVGFLVRTWGQHWPLWTIISLLPHWNLDKIHEISHCITSP